MVALVSDVNKAAYVTFSCEDTHLGGFRNGYIRHAKEQQEKNKELSPLSIFLLSSDDIEIRMLKENITYHDISDFRNIYERKIASKGYEIIRKAQNRPVTKEAKKIPLWDL